MNQNDLGMKASSLQLDHVQYQVVSYLGQGSSATVCSVAAAGDNVNVVVAKVFKASLFLFANALNISDFHLLQPDAHEYFVREFSRLQEIATINIKISRYGQVPIIKGYSPDENTLFMSPVGKPFAVHEKDYVSGCKPCTGYAPITAF